MKFFTILLIFSIFSSLFLVQNTEAASSNTVCTEHSDCLVSGEYCISGLCKNLRESSTRRPLPTRPLANTTGSCTADSDCKTGQICNSNKVCVTPRLPIRPSNTTVANTSSGQASNTSTLPPSGPGRDWIPRVPGEGLNESESCYFSEVCEGGECEWVDSCPFGYICRNSECRVRAHKNPDLGRDPIYCGELVTESVTLDTTDPIVHEVCPYTGIYARAERINIDCNGFTIRGRPYAESGYYSSGVAVVGKKNVDVQNCGFQGFPYGVTFSNTESGEIIGNHFINITDYAVRFIQASSNHFGKNTVEGSNGLHFQDSDGNTLYDNYFSVEGYNILGWIGDGNIANGFLRNDFISGRLVDREGVFHYCNGRQGNYFSSDVPVSNVRLRGCPTNTTRWTTYKDRNICSSDSDCDSGEICKRVPGGSLCSPKPIELERSKRPSSAIDILKNIFGQRPRNESTEATSEVLESPSIITTIMCLLGFCEIDTDADNDGVDDLEDNCRDAVNTDQWDSDNDSIGDMCDDTPFPVEAVCVDGEFGSPCGLLERCHEGECLTFREYTEATTDTDGDGVFDDVDNCKWTENLNQNDSDDDGIGDVCDFGADDTDGDGIPDGEDNCLNDANPGQHDNDSDGRGDACDGDRDGDGVINLLDNCPDAANTGQEDSDDDRIGDACDPDPLPAGACATNADCPAGQTCRDNVCQSAATTFPFTYERFDSPEKVLVIIDDLGQNSSDFEHPHANWVTEVSIQTPGSPWVSQLETRLDFNFCSLPNWSCVGGYTGGQSYQCDGSGGSCVYSIPTLLHLVGQGIQFLLQNEGIRSLTPSEIIENPDYYYNFLEIPIDASITEYNVNVFLGHWEDVSMIWDRPLGTRWSLYKEKWWSCDSASRGWYEAIYTFPVGGTSSEAHT